MSVVIQPSQFSVSAISSISLTYIAWLKKFLMKSFYRFKPHTLFLWKTYYESLLDPHVPDFMNLLELQITCMPPLLDIFNLPPPPLQISLSLHHPQLPFLTMKEEHLLHILNSPRRYRISICLTRRFSHIHHNILVILTSNSCLSFTSF